MDQARMDRAMTRIEAALARIERAAARDPGGSDLEARHAALRASVTSSLAELDALIGSLEK